MDKKLDLVELVGKEVYCMCASYAYGGVLTSVSDKFVQINDPAIVYETGPWDSKTWKDAQRLPTNKVTVGINSIESIFEVIR